MNNHAEKQACSHRKYFARTEGDEIVLENSAGSEIIRAKKTAQGTVTRHRMEGPQDIFTHEEMTLEEMSVDDLVWCLIQDEDYSPV